MIDILVVGWQYRHARYRRFIGRSAISIYFSILVGHIEKTSVAVENHRSNHQMTVAAAMLSIDSSETDKIFAPRPL
jgi:hypothetical protein